METCSTKTYEYIAELLERIEKKDDEIQRLKTVIDEILGTITEYQEES